MYKLSTNTSNQTVVIRDNGNETTTSFIEDPANTDYQAYLKWLEEGNSPIPSDNPASPDAAPAEEQ